MQIIARWIQLGWQQQMPKRPELCQSGGYPKMEETSLHAALQWSTLGISFSASSQEHIQHLCRCQTILHSPLSERSAVPTSSGSTHLRWLHAIKCWWIQCIPQLTLTPLSASTAYFGPFTRVADLLSRRSLSSVDTHRLVVPISSW